MNLTSFVFFLSFIVVYFLKCVNLQYIQCVNPQNIHGVCVPLQSCLFLLNILRSYPNDSQWFLRQSACGFDQRSNIQYMCCPKYHQQHAEERNFVKPQPAVPVTTTTEKNLPGNLLPKCGFDLDNRIFGGKLTNIGDFAWLALLRYSKPGSSSPIFKCSASLINNRYVLTAAHCIHPRLLQNSRLIGIRLGEWNLLTGEDCEIQNGGKKICAPNAIDLSPEEIHIHENYQPLSRNQFNDIALIRLSKRVQYTEFIKPICLQSDKNLKVMDLIGQSLVVTGFGANEKSASSNVKLHVSLNVVENEMCNKIFRSEGRRLNDTIQLCAGGVKNEDSCKGDSGSPLMKLVNKNQHIFWVLYGIVSFGVFPCGQQNIPGVYTKVDQYVDWIESKLKL